MDIFLIWGLIPDGSGFLSLAGGWDQDCIDGNSEGYLQDILSAEKDYGSRYVTVTKAEVDIDAIRSLFDSPAKEFAVSSVNLIWRVEDGYLELVDAWDDDTISENPEGWEDAVAKGDGNYRVTSHCIDLDAVRATLEPVSVPLS